MAFYAVRRALAGIPTLLLVFTLVFLIAHATPGSPWDIGSNRPIEPSIKAALDAKFHLDEPLPVQYVQYLLGALQGDLGPSYRNRTQSVTDIILHFLPVSLELGAAAMLLAILLGLPLGALAALTRGSWIDGLIRMISTLGISMPTYVVTSILIVSLGVGLGWVPTAIWHGAFSTSAIVPVFSLALAPLAAIIRYFRNSMLEVMHLDYVRTARAKGLANLRVIMAHAFRNALLPIATIIGLQLGGVFSGAVLTETIFGLAGVGRMLYEGITARDYPVIQGFTLVIAFGYVAVNLVVDLSYAFFDPRIRYE
jgi:ABC-type dipeptide/oligopeptide/nickel transport system permease component